jgi:hypothetical protein
MFTLPVMTSLALVEAASSATTLPARVRQRSY